MVELAGFRVGEVELTRVPYFDVALDPAVVGLTVAEIESVDWARPYWASADGQVLVGQAVWVIGSQDTLIVVDPCGASDQFLRSGPEAVGHQEAVLAALLDAGYAPERVDIVVLSHLDGIGMAAVVEPDGSWAPAFPNARIVMTAAELEWLAGDGGGGAAAGPDGLHVLNELIARGVVDGVEDGHQITEEVSLELTGAHTPGHAIVHVRSAGERATLLGHLALSPIKIATGARADEMGDSEATATALAALVADASAGETLLIGPLWPFPGAGYATADRTFTAAD